MGGVDQHRINNSRTSDLFAGQMQIFDFCLRCLYRTNVKDGPQSSIQHNQILATPWQPRNTVKPTQKASKMPDQVTNMIQFKSQKPRNSDYLSGESVGSDHIYCLK